MKALLFLLVSVSAFIESFDYPDLASSPWTPSVATKKDQGRTLAYTGEWAIEESKVYPGIAGKKGLVLKSRARHHAIARALPEPFNNTGRDLVLQYEIKLQQELKCGGSYIKLLDKNDEGYANFSSETPYQVMFGPDRCGSNDKVHFILRRPKRGISGGEMEEKHLVAAPMSRGGHLTNLYTLIIRHNQDFEIRINGEVAKAGNLVTSTHLMDPPVNPPKEVIDWDAEKPDDWDDRPYIPDPSVEKPEDYERLHENVYIDDPDAKKPEDWDENEPMYIEDPSATRPEAWDDEEDGKWLAPEIPNPKCKEHGCGPWKPPKIANKDYVGPWYAPEIINPNYMGEWPRPMKPNPDYFEDLRPSDLAAEIGGIGFDLWSMESDILFDNIYLGHDIHEAEVLGNTTWAAKNRAEKAYKEATKKPIAHEPVPPPPDFDELVLDESVVSRIRKFVHVAARGYYEEMRVFVALFLDDPVHTIAERPLEFMIYCATFVVVFSTGAGVLLGMIALFLVYTTVNESERRKQSSEKESTETDSIEKELTETEKDTSEAIDEVYVDTEVEENKGIRKRK